jgi:hypothetical protein
MLQLAESTRGALVAHVLGLTPTNSFLPIYYALLAATGLLAGVHRFSTWKRTLIAGGGCGLISGILAIVIVLALKPRSPGAISIERFCELTVGVLFCSLLFLTPVWGMACAAIVRLVVRENH